MIINIKISYTNVSYHKHSYELLIQYFLNILINIFSLTLLTFTFKAQNKGSDSTVRLLNINLLEF